LQLQNKPFRRQVAVTIQTATTIKP